MIMHVSRKTTVASFYSIPLFVIQNLSSIEGVENASLNKLINRIKPVH